MYRIKRPKKDTTIYSDEPCKNTGLDEILELNTKADELPAGPTCDPSYLDTTGTEFETNYPPDELLPNASNPTAEDVVDELYPKIERFGKSFESVRAQKSRVLIKFEIDDWIDEINEELDVASGEDTIDYDVFLRMYSTESRELPNYYSLNAHPLKDTFSYLFNYSELDSWDTSHGRKYNDTDAGVSWIFRDISGNYRWDRPGGDFFTTDPDDSSVEVYDSQEFDFESPDVYMSIKNVFDFWRDYGNAGLLLKRSDVEEKMKQGIYTAIENLGELTRLSFFGGLTHTIYAPEIILATDDHEWYTDAGELIMYADDIEVTVTNLKEEYSNNERPRMRVAVEEMFPDKIFLEDDEARDRRRTPKYLEEGTLTYSIKDDISKKTIVPFSKYSQLSFDPDGYYFDLDLNNYYPERVYEIEFKYEDPEDGFSHVFKTDQKFKVVN